MQNYMQWGPSKKISNQYCRAFEQIFEAIDTSENMKYLVHASYLEIYNEDIRWNIEKYY